jgi:hypothetical protein
MTACSNSGRVTVTGTGTRNVGGVAGWNTNGSISVCYNKATVNSNSSGSVTGGVVGLNDEASAIITACYNSGAVTSGGSPGGVVGQNVSGATNTACYWFAGAGGNAASGVGTGGATGVTSFGAGTWPSGGEWGTGPALAEGGTGGSGRWWQSIGRWNNGSPEFPVLYWE